MAKGTVLWRPGDPADFAFLLVTGHVGVSWRRDWSLIGDGIGWAPGDGKKLDQLVNWSLMILMGLDGRLGMGWEQNGSTGELVIDDIDGIGWAH